MKSFSPDFFMERVGHCIEDCYRSIASVSSMKDKVAYRRILDIFKYVERVDSKLIFWELLKEAYDSEILHEPSNRNKIIDEIEQRKKDMIEALEDAVPEC